MSNLDTNILEYPEKMRKKAQQLINHADRDEDIREDLNSIDMYNKVIMSIAWDGMPDTIPELSTEAQLFTKGKSAFFYSKDYGYMCLPFTYTSGVNDYNMYTKLKPISLNGIDYPELTINKDCVILYDNPIGIPAIAYCNMFSTQLNYIKNIKYKNINFLRLPFIFKSSGIKAEDNKRAFAIKQIFTSDDNAYGYVTSAFDNIELLDFKLQYYGAELQQAINDIKSEFFEWLGVSHLSIEKRERMTEDEVNIYEESNTLNINKRLLIREKQANKINKMFGLSLKPYSTFSKGSVKIEDDNI